MIGDADTIALATARLKQKNYEWQFDAEDFNHPNLLATLVDNFLGLRTPIRLSGTTVIPFTVTSDAASSAADRFRVVFATAKALPVHISTVKAQAKGLAVEVEWTVQTELNMDKYEVEKSATGQHFDKLATVLSYGNSAASKTYSILDPMPLNGNNYYRIKSVNKAGEAHYSTIVKVNTGNNKSQVTVYPNPVTGNTLTLQLNNLDKGKYTVAVFNKKGQQVLVDNLQHAGSTAAHSVGLPNISKGIYELIITGNGKTITQKIIKN